MTTICSMNKNKSFSNNRSFILVKKIISIKIVVINGIGSYFYYKRFTLCSLNVSSTHWYCRASTLIKDKICWTNRKEIKQNSFSIKKPFSNDKQS